MSDESANAWRCNICGYVHRESAAPDACPVCGASRADFEAYVETLPVQATSAASAWRCLNCSYIQAGNRPPRICPVCGVPADQFEPLEEPGGPQSALGADGRIVVVGAGIAGVSAVEAIRRTSPAATVTLVSKESDLPYYRLNLTRYLAGEISGESLAIHPAAWYEQNGVEFLCGVEVAELLPDEHAVTLRGGKRLSFDKLILTAGAHPFIPPLPGGRREGVTTLRTRQDADFILDSLQRAGRCVCIGGGVLGVETAGALARRGADVTLLEGHGWLMPRQLNEAAGAKLKDHIESLSIHLRTRAKVKEILGDERVAGVLLEDGTTLPADLVIIAAGVRPNSYLARQAGLHVGNGIVVDDHLLTSHPDILAAGDIAGHRGTLYGTWGPSQFQGSIAGMNAVGGQAEFGGIPRSNTLKVLGIDLVSIGRIEPEDGSYQAVESADGKIYRRFMFHDGRLVGAVLLGDATIAPQVKKAIADGVDLSGLILRQPKAADVEGYLVERTGRLASAG